MDRIFTQTIFARRLGFKSANDTQFKRLLKKACELKVLEVQQSGFSSHSLEHPKIVIQHKPFDFLHFAEEVSGVPSSLRGQMVYGYRLMLCRTGKRRKLKNGKYSKIEWWRCGCGREIRVGSPYASKVQYRGRQPNGTLPLMIKCFPCFLDLVEISNL